MGMHAHELKRLLMRELKERLVPILIDKGFAYVPLLPAEARSELKIAFPLGRLKRERDSNVDVIEFQFDKRSRPKFVVNFGTVPEDGVTVPWGLHFTRDEVGVSACPEAYRLYNSKIGEKWFQFGFLTPRTEAAAKSLVDKATGLSQEVIAWFDSKAVGKHIRKFGIHA